MLSEAVAHFDRNMLGPQLNEATFSLKLQTVIHTSPNQLLRALVEARTNWEPMVGSTKQVSKTSVEVTYSDAQQPK